jgi:hypothetical protein
MPFERLPGCAWLGCLILLAAAWPAPAQSPASLRVVVADPTGGVIVGARVELTPLRGTPVSQVTDDQGVATFTRLASGRWGLRVSSPGFTDYVDPALALRPAANRLEVLLEIAGFSDEVIVTRDPQEAATDPQGATSVALTEAELDSLPDTEEDLRQALNELAGPDAELQVDGFTDGTLPSRDQIQEVRIRRTMFSADNHYRGGSRIEVVTRPGTESWRSNVGFTFRDEALNGRNAFAPIRPPEQFRRFSGSISGPIVRNRTSLSLSLEHLTSYDAPTIRAVGTSGTIAGAVRQPEEERRFTVRAQHGLTRAHSVMAEYQERRGDEENLGVGGVDLPERAYSRESRRRQVRLGSTATIARRFYNEARLQGSWDRNASLALVDAPTIRVLDSVTSGGANIRGGRTERSLQLTERLDFRLASHAISVGGRFDWFGYESDEIRNALGTFTFSSPDELAAGRPRTFTQRRGDPTVSYAMFQGGWFVQDDIRLRRNLTIGLGLRHEWQSHLDDRLNLAPRAGFSWSPAQNGRTTIRGGAGVFYDWYGASTYEETLQVDGRRVEELTIESPSYPDPFIAGEQVVVLPNGRVQASAALKMPTIRQATLVVERRIGPVRADVSLTYRDGIDQLRGRNLNAPGPDGIRPDPLAGNVVEIQSIGRSRAHEIGVSLSGRLPWRGLFFSGRYNWARARDDGDGATSLPADNLAPDEWGASRGDVRHRFSSFATLDLIRGVQLGVNTMAQSAPPYTITTGRDDNGDTVFNDRPAGVARNTARGDGQFRMDLRLSWRLDVGQRPGRGAAAAQRGRQGGGGGGGGGQPQPRVRAELYIRATNVLNTVNKTGFSGVMTSPLFGLPRSAQAARRAELGMRVRF